MGKKNRKSVRDRVKASAKNRDRGSTGSKFNFEGVDYYKPTKNSKKLIIVPYKVSVDDNPDAKKGELWYKKKILVHYGIGAEDQALICPKTVGKRCPICEDRAILVKDGYKKNEEAIKELNTSKREIFNVIDPDDDPKEILFWEVAYGNFGELLDEEIEEASDDDYILGIADLEDRPILNVRFKKAKFSGNAYLKISKIDARKGKNLPESILDDVIDLDRCLKILSYDKINKIYLDMEDDSHSESKKKGKKKGKKKKNSEDDVPF